MQVDAVTDPFCGSVPDLVVAPGRIRSGVILLSGAHSAVSVAGYETAHKWRFSTAWYGTVRYGSLLGGFPLGTVPGT